ncbi:MAG: hypothetical protein V4820_11650 [Pseudomonadota bacterium]
MPADPNLVTADQAAVTKTVEGAPVEPAKVGDVLKKGAAPPDPSKRGAEVMVRVTKRGHGQIHDGEGGAYDWNDEVILPRKVAEAQEDNAFAEIIG